MRKDLYHRRNFLTAGGYPFTPTEKRLLTLRADRIDPKYIIDGEPPGIEAEHKRTERHPTHEARHYQLRIADCGLRITNNVKIQLNHGDSAEDERRLAGITEDLLSVEENPQSAILNPQSGGEE